MRTIMKILNCRCMYDVIQRICKNVAKMRDICEKDWHKYTRCLNANGSFLIQRSADKDLCLVEWGLCEGRVQVIWLLHCRCSCLGKGGKISRIDVQGKKEMNKIYCLQVWWLFTHISLRPSFWRQNTKWGKHMPTIRSNNFCEEIDKDPI